MVCFLPLRFSPSLLCLVFFSCVDVHRYLHSFPTRRSSDLVEAAAPSYRRLWRCGRDGTRRIRITCTSTPGPTLKDRKSTRLNSSHTVISYAVFCLKKKI